MIVTTTDPVAIVLACDTDSARPPGAPVGEEATWYPASGQPAAATRWLVRPLSTAGLVSAQDEALTVADLVAAQLVSVDSRSVAADEMRASWPAWLPAALWTSILDLSLHGRPTWRRSSTMTGDA